MIIKNPYGFPNDLLDQIREMTRLPPGVEEALRQNEALMDPIQRQLDAIKPVYERFEKDYLEPFKEIQAQAALLMDPVREQIQQMTQGLGGTLEAIFRSFEDFPARTRQGLLAMAETGWCLDPEMPATALNEVKEEIDSQKLEQVNADFANYFRQELDRIEADIVLRHPTRAAIIQSAFAAHREGRYELSIPVLLAQADGVSRDLTGCQLYNGKLAGYVKRKALEELEKAYLAPLLANIPMVYPEGRRGPEFRELNRHAVLHGESLDYGTEENGLKAVSLLNYVSFALDTSESGK